METAMSLVDETCWNILKSDYNFFLAMVRPSLDPGGAMPDGLFNHLAEDFYNHLRNKYDGPSHAMH